MSTSTRIAGLLCGALLSASFAAAAAHHLPAKQSAPAVTEAQQGPVVPVSRQSSVQQAAVQQAAVQQAAVQQAAVQQAAVQQAPLSPEEMPATPPKVTMSAGRLSIVADNSTLGDVLNAVKKLTGASLDIPGSAAAERVAVDLGPGEPQQVLQQLFAGSRFDYIILGSPSNANAVEKIILTARGAVAGTTAANQPPHNANQPAPPSDDSGGDDEISQQPEPPPQPEEAQPQQIGPGGEAAAQENQQNQQPKSPEQLLQELQRMQQQQQQQGRPPREATPQ